MAGRMARCRDAASLKGTLEVYLAHLFCRISASFDKKMQEKDIF
jgi:hypothetical protein